MRHGMHVEYSTISGLQGHFKELKNFLETLNKKSAPKDMSAMFWRLFWYVSRGRTTKIDFGER